jgi:hypothetical protein
LPPISSSFGTAFRTREMSSDVTPMPASLPILAALFRLGEVVQVDPHG